MLTQLQAVASALAAGVESDAACCANGAWRAECSAVLAHELAKTGNRCSWLRMLATGNGTAVRECGMLRVLWWLALRVMRHVVQMEPAGRNAVLNDRISWLRMQTCCTWRGWMRMRTAAGALAAGDAACCVNEACQGGMQRFAFAHGWHYGLTHRPSDAKMPLVHHKKAGGYAEKLTGFKKK